MTTVVYDGHKLASDSMLVDGDIVDLGPNAPKFYVRGGLLFAWCGTAVWHERLCEHVLSLRRRSNRLPYPLDPSSPATVSVWNGKGWRRYHSDAAGFETPRGCWAIGSGAPFALAALVMGADAVLAVRVAAQLDINTGGQIFACDVGAVDLKAASIDVEEHEPIKVARRKQPSRNTLRKVQTHAEL